MNKFRSWFMAAMLCGVPGISAAQTFYTFSIEHSGSHSENFSLSDFNRITFEASSTILLSGNDANNIRNIEFNPSQPLRISFKREFSDAKLLKSDNRVTAEYLPLAKAIRIKMLQTSPDCNATCCVYSLSGVTLLNTTVSGTCSDISVDHLMPGIYIALVKTLDGNVVSLKLKI